MVFLLLENSIPRGVKQKHHGKKILVFEILTFITRNLIETLDWQKEFLKLQHLSFKIFFKKKKKKKIMLARLAEMEQN